MEDLTITHYLTIPATELQAVYSRSGGPGGQNVNKVNSKATLIWDLNQTQALFPMALMRLKAMAASRINDEGFLKIHCPSPPRAVPKLASVSRSASGFGSRSDEACCSAQGDQAQCWGSPPSVVRKEAYR